MARPAQGQIYSWKDANGILTLADHPQGSAKRIAQAVPTYVGAPLLLSRGLGFEALIRQHAGLQSIRAELVRAVIQVESAFNPRAVSPKGAMGLMQLMPSTAARYGVIDPFNPAENIRAGVSYLRQLMTRYNDNEQLALAAYNAGPGAVDKYGSKVPPYKETQSYVQRITNLNGVNTSAPGLQMYKVTDFVDGRPVVKYTNIRPTSGTYEEVRR
jgi:soluble lytic murein transglycosylase-like protein